MDKLRKENELIDIFYNLVRIPSPSLHEERVVEWIKNFCKQEKLNFSTDSYNNVIIKLDATDNTKPLLALSSHMDVVGDDSPVVPILDGDFIHANGRTLGGDDKFGVASALKLLKDVKNSDLKHGGLEVVFTRDEESGMSGIHNFDFNMLNSKYVLVCDADEFGVLQISGASYCNGHVEISCKGGHSGIDIADRTKPNAAKLIAELCNNIPQGVYYQDETGVVTSINLGGIKAGDTNVTNVLNPYAEATYSIRSADLAKENELIDKIQYIIAEFNKKYDGIAVAKGTFKQKMPAFEKSNDTYIPEVFERAAKKLNVNYVINSFHAGAETHIYCQHKNSKGETFIPFLIGLANLYNMHSPDEKIDYKSFLKGYDLLKEFFIEFNNK
ncbi:M20/M25/M40 family metallo-hydrolase [bacterium]|nr:M20/M25/M40 family metallo-hydrolase [bacterium]